MFGVNDADAVEGLQKDLNQFYAANKDCYKINGPLTFARIKTSGDWPKLKCKAASTRHIIRYCKDLCNRYNSGSVHDRRRLAIVSLLDRFYSICAEEGRYLSTDAKEELPKLVQNFMGIYKILSLEAKNDGQRKWKFVQKFHLFNHLCELQMILYGNGRMYWTYSDEDLQRILKKIAVGCHSKTVAWMTLYRWAIVFFEH